MVLERPDGKSERFFSTVSASEVVKSHPSHQLSSSPPPYLTAALSASSESNNSVLPIISARTCIYTHLFQSIITYSLSPATSLFHMAFCSVI
ncbi:BnaC04g13560D [Brassica napus]|uniref:BnaC04g13560D protein n=3 Tax=Brassica TaxID=3705 RepID=A0A078GH92_BRANA|nr:BnaC04g13560D [Brassica napus]